MEPGGAHHATPMQRLRHLLAVERGDLWVVVGYSAAIGLLALVTPVAVQVLVNQISFAVLLQPVVIMTAFVLVGWGLSGLLRVLQIAVVELLQQRLFVRAAADLAVRLPAVQISAWTRGHGPELVNRFLDIVTVQKSAAGLLLDALGIVLQSVMGLLVLAFYHPLLLAFDVALIACILLVVWGLGRHGTSTSIAESRAKYAVVDWLWEVARNPLLFKSETHRVIFRADALLGSYVAARRRHFRVVLRQIGGALALQALGSAALLGLGGALVIAGQLTVGQLVAAEIIVSGVLAGIAKLGKHLESYYDLMAALDKLGHLEDLPLERGGGVPASSGGCPGAALRLHEVQAGHEAERPVLQGISLTVQPGDKVAIVGSRGSGKSLLCELLLGLHAPASGLIEFDGQELRSLSLESLRSQVMLLRCSELITGTIVENLVGGRTDRTPGELRTALQAVDLWDELCARPGGLDSPLESEARTLSAGQKRRLAVARVLLHRPRLLLIDDGPAFSAEELVPLCAPSSPWTVLLFTHSGDPALALCQELYLLAGGTLAAAASGSSMDAAAVRVQT